LPDVRAWLIAVSADRQAVLATERFTVMVIRGGRLGTLLERALQAGHGRPARMSASHA